MTRKTLIAGATGRTGKIIVDKLLQTGIKPTVLVRDIPTAKCLWENSVSYHQGDVRDVDTLFPAMEDIGVIVSAVGTSSPVGKNCPKRVYYQGVANLVQAALAEEVRRFILISSVAVTHPEHPLNHFGHILEWKYEGEQVLRHSGLEYAIIRPGELKNTPGSLRKLKFGQEDNLLGLISRKDLAEICIKAVQYPHPLRTTFEVIESDLTDEHQWRPQFITSGND
jgi:uncharacterized protein YbjT (DUF2867 family)